MFLIFIHRSSGSSLFIFSLLFYTHYINLPEFMNSPSDEQFAVLPGYCQHFGKGQVLLRQGQGSWGGGPSDMGHYFPFPQL